MTTDAKTKKKSAPHKAVALLLCLLVVNAIHFVELKGQTQEETALAEQEELLSNLKTLTLRQIRNGQIARSMGNELTGWEQVPSPVEYLKLLEQAPESMKFTTFSSDISPLTKPLPPESRGYWFKEALQFSGNVELEFEGETRNLKEGALNRFSTEVEGVNGHSIELVEIPRSEEEIQESGSCFTLRATIPGFTAWVPHE